MRTLAIHELEARKPDKAAVDAWMNGRKFPIVEGQNVTLVYRGNVDSISLRHWIYGLETNTALKRLDNTDLWFLVVEIPPTSRIEYKFEIKRNGQLDWIEDPLNPNRARDPFGANSVMQGDGYELPEWIKPDPQARKGTLEPFTLKSRALDGERHGHIYLPARFRRSRVYPLLVVHDGSDYLRFSSMQTVLDNLIHKLDIPDVIAVFTDSPDRLREYAADPGHARYITEELLPDIARRFPLYDNPAARCLMGASFGGVASLSTAWRHPGVWGSLLLQSGSFAFTDIGRSHRRGPLFDRVVEFMNAFRAAPTAISERVFVTCGTYEPLIYENRSIVPLLDGTGMQVKYLESRDGHNWENWRDRLRDGLSWLMPGPLMMIYE